MPRKRILKEVAACILGLYVLNGLNKVQIAESLGISRNTVTKFLRFYEQADLNKSDLLTLARILHEGNETQGKYGKQG
jgi:hypothetical protein